MLSLLAVVTWLGLLVLAGAEEPETGNHPDWPRWCGKVYKSGYPAFDPGGHTVERSTAPGAPLLYLQFKPRYSLYVDTETAGEFVVNAGLSDWDGQTFPDGHDRKGNLDFVIRLDGEHLILAQGSVAINSSGNLFAFPLAALAPTLTPYNVTLAAVIAGSEAPEFRASTELLYLPDKQPGSGSVTRLDNLNGGVFFKNAASDNKFVPFFAYGYYSADDGFLGHNDTSLIDAYSSHGLSAMIPLAQYPKSASAFTYLDQINLRYQYDLREGYKNITWVEENVLASKDNEAIFSYWSTDEPDGHQDPFGFPVAAYALIRRLDPYHPVDIVLNCQDYYFGPYSDPCDMITEDVYPIGIDTTGISKWGTPCNTTIGDCGCDNCIGGAHAILDVRDRLDTLARYERLLGWWPKSKVHVLQSFHGEGYWERDPTPEESWAMALIAVNHGARGLSAWVHPAPEVLLEAHGRLARVLSTAPVVDVLMGAKGRGTRVDVGAGYGLDVIYWVRGEDMVVSAVNPTYDTVAEAVEVDLPGVRSFERVLWGNISWTWTGSRLATPQIPALGTSIVLLKAASRMQ